jgi:hypothetical protein
MLPTMKMKAHARLEVWLSDIRVWVRPPIEVNFANHFQTDVKFSLVELESCGFLHMVPFMENKTKTFEKKDFFYNVVLSDYFFN